MSVLRSVFWFNPFFWMAEKDLEEVQEWEADKDVLDEGWNLKTYRTTIFKQLFGYNPDITCGLNHSLTKQRFIMMTQSHRGKGAWLRLAATLPVIALVFLAFGCGVKSQEEAVETTNLTLDEQEPLTFRIHVAKSNEEKGTYSIYCNDNLTDIETISKTVSEYFAGEEMFNTTVSISADENVPMGIITDIKEQLRNARALKVRYETDDSAIEKRLPPAPKTDMYPATVDALAGTNRRNIIVMRVNPNGELFLGSTYVKGSLHNDDLYAKELARLKELISNPDENAECPEIEMMDIQMPDGSTRQFRVSKGMITFQNDRATSYEDYTKAMKLITTAYKELREEVSSEVFGKTLAELTDAEMQVIYQAVPMNVSEAEPKDVPARN
jgi:biopolymer transport protein ExbD